MTITVVIVVVMLMIIIIITWPFMPWLMAIGTAGTLELF